MEECMEARAFKSSSIFTELVINQRPFPDDFLCLTGLPVADDFSIDQFFDLPNDDNQEQEEEEQDEDHIEDIEEEEELEKDSSSSSSSSSSSVSSSTDPIHQSLSNFSADLAIPVDYVQELELWSHLMDDSVPLVCPNIFLHAHNAKPRQNRAIPFIPSAVPVKPRTKRPRTPAIRSWLSPKHTQSSSSTLLFNHHIATVFIFGESPVKSKLSTGSTEGRRCSHCQVTKTPQWRAGPNGPKSLCNACGVRFKAGRLYPEYRPACSPTFSSEVHSNSHRKVLEMRRKRGAGVDRHSIIESS